MCKRRSGSIWRGCEGGGCVEQDLFVEFDPSFPLADIQKIVDRLAFGGIFASHVSFRRDPRAFQNLIHLILVDGFEVIALPDRNLSSRMADVARNGVSSNRDVPTQLAADFMALCQCLNITIEPSISFHEFASTEGNQAAIDELGWFRAADHDQAPAWVDLAMGRANLIEVQEMQSVAEVNLVRNLDRWRANYAVALEIAEVELSGGKSLNKFMSVLDWMSEEFFLAGPALMFAAMYFGPQSRRSGMLKKLRSENRVMALNGIRNAAWDITHLSDFVERIGRQETKKAYLFGTADKALSSIAEMLITDSEPGLELTWVAGKLSDFWLASEAFKISSAILKARTEAVEESTKSKRKVSQTELGRIIEGGEAHIANFITWVR